MEIQEGDGPFAPTVSRPLRIGETITLVVRGRTSANNRIAGTIVVPILVNLFEYMKIISSDQYNMFVHSCNAVDGTGTIQVELIDRFG
jgi:hypothetical protein